MVFVPFISVMVAFSDNSSGHTFVQSGNSAAAEWGIDDSWNTSCDPVFNSHQSGRLVMLYHRVPHLSTGREKIFRGRKNQSKNIEIPLAFFQKYGTMVPGAILRAGRCEPANLTVCAYPNVAWVGMTRQVPVGWEVAAGRRGLPRGVISHPLWQREIVQHAVSDFQKSSYL